MALSRLLVVSENYPTLRAHQAFGDLQAQLEGTENRIAVARNCYIKAVQDYNVTVPVVPVESHGDGLRLQGETELRSREREGHCQAARSGTWQGHTNSGRSQWSSQVSVASARTLILAATLCCTSFGGPSSHVLGIGRMV